jgi:uncharacterized repeat protein (TIGR01451 family)
MKNLQKKSFYKILVSLFTIVGTIIFSFLLFDNISKVNAQTSGWPYCGFQCQAGDTYVTSFNLVDSSHNPILTCNPGDQINGIIRVTIYNNANSDRKAPVLLGDIYSGEQQIAHLATQVGPNLIDGVCVSETTIPKKSFLTADIYNFTWTCGEPLTIRNMVLSWTTGNDTCADHFSNPSCGNRTTKCYSSPSFLVTTPLVADFIASNVCFGNTVSFQDKSSGGLLPYTYSWLSDSVQISTAKDFLYTYGTFGTKSVTLNVKDSLLQTDSQTKSVYVWKNPVASFTTSTFTGYAPLTVNFTNTSTLGGAAIISWLWNFGDGNTSTLVNPSHTYLTDGTYNVTLTVSDANGCTHTSASTAITVLEPLAYLTLEKTVVNDDGGTATEDDFQAYIDTDDVDWDVAVPLVAGTYTASEITSVTGYDPSDWSGDCDADGSITLTPGQNATCAITNDDIAPTITLNKVVQNNYGGTAGVNAFGLSIGTTTVNSGQELKVKANEAIAIDEDGLYGYEFVSITGKDCPTELGGTVTLDVGEDLVCTITNRDIQPKLTVIKTVVNNEGGQAVASNFTMLVTGTNVSSSSFAGSSTGTLVTLNAGSYSVDEQAYTGYSKSIGANCSGTISVGDEKTCTITNTDIAPTLTLVKVVVNNNGGTKGISDFPLFVGATQVTSGTPVTLKSNLEYTVSETNQSGYQASSWTGDCSTDGKITLQPGQNKTCTITNDDIAPSLTLVKNVVNSYGGTASATDWTLYANGSTNISGAGGVTSGSTFSAGTYTLSESIGPNGYTAGDWVCTGVTNTDDLITIGIGQSATCTITNTALPGTIIVKKDVTKKSEGENIFSDATFGVMLDQDIAGMKTIRDSSTERIDATFGLLNAGTYTLTEVQEDGYLFMGCYPELPEIRRGELSLLNIYDPLNPEIQLGNGETITYVCYNEVIQPQLEIEKLNDTGGLGMSAGDIVTYTIIVKAPADNIDGKYLLKNVVVTDILPEGFEYILGSWTGTTNEPVYNGVPAKWEIGDMEEGDVVILTYKALISTTQEPGVYPDIAWVSGEDILEESVLGISSVEPTENFVGTKVLVVAEEELEEGEVLGATTTETIELPSTGANILITIGAIVSMILGFILLLFKPKKKVKVLLLTTILLLGMSIFLTPKATYATESEKINVVISEPQTPTNKTSFNIVYGVADLDSRSLTIECLEETYGKYATHNTYSGNCAVGASIITGSGTYTFTVKATANDGSGDYKISKPVTVVVDLETPTAITNYTKTEGVCTYTLSFTTGSKSTKVQIFRSTTQPFTANASTLIKEIAVTPNQYVTYTDTIPICAQEYFYAVRTTDNVNNTSPIVTDPIVKTVEVLGTDTVPQTTNTPTTPPRTTTPIIAEEDTEEEVKGEEEMLDTEAPEELEEVEKEESDKDDEDEKKGNAWLIAIIAILLLGSVGYLYVKRQRTNY